ncbi:MAG: hypothetical protein K2Y21_06555 [Phycisphaerales bacterium]|nr:hypothetical protein [Phycisphaerales bacterium]
MSVVLCTLGGCRIAAPSQADNTRQENAALKERVALLEARTSELEAKLAARAPSTDAAEIAKATPVIAGIEIDGFTGFGAVDPAGKPRRFTVYVKPYDGRRRFVQAVGTLLVEARAADGTVIASRSLSVAEVREAYRSQVTGTYYAIEAEVPENRVGEVANVRAVLQDLLTGARHEATRELRTDRMRR